MKILNNKYFSIIAICIAFGAAISIWSCGSKEDLSKDVKIYIDADIIRVPLTVQYVDANEANAPQNATQDNDNSFFPDLDIKVTGRDAAKIYTMVLNKNFRVEKGVIEFVVKREDMPKGNGTGSLEFNVEATSKSGKFLKTVKSYTLTDSITSADVIKLINVNAPPKGVDITNATVTVGANGATATTINTNKGQNEEKTEVKVPAGTKFYDKDGKELTGTVDVRLVYFNNRDSATSLDAFPGGFAVPKANDLSGKALEPGRFSTYGFIALDMSVGTSKVKSFSGTGLEVTMGINPNSPNPDETGKIKAGDKIPVWSIDLDEADKGWNQEVIGTVSGTGNDLKVTFSQKHLSYWNLDIFWNSCFNSTLVRFPSTGFSPGNYYVEVVKAGTGTVEAHFYDNLVPNSLHTLYFMPLNQSYYIKMYKVIGCSRQLMYRSQYFQSCAPVGLTLQALPTTSNIFTVAGYVSGVCASQPSVVVRPSSTVYYRPSGTGNTCWTLLGVVLNGNFVLSGVKSSNTNQSYDFKVVVGGFHTQYFYNKTPDLNDPRIPAPIASSGGVAFYNLSNIPIPANYCSMIGF